jgi:hypothetical protein
MQPVNFQPLLSCLGTKTLRTAIVASVALFSSLGAAQVFPGQFHPGQFQTPNYAQLSSQQLFSQSVVIAKRVEQYASRVAVVQQNAVPYPYGSALSNIYGELSSYYTSQELQINTYTSIHREIQTYFQQVTQSGYLNALQHRAPHCQFSQGILRDYYALQAINVVIQSRVTSQTLYGATTAPFIQQRARPCPYGSDRLRVPGYGVPPGRVFPGGFQGGFPGGFQGGFQGGLQGGFGVGPQPGLRPSGFGFTPGY